MSAGSESAYSLAIERLSEVLDEGYEIPVGGAMTGRERSLLEAREILARASISVDDWQLERLADWLRDDDVRIELPHTRARQIVHVLLNRGAP